MRRVALLVALPLAACEPSAPSNNENPVAIMVEASGSDRLGDIPFADVILAATGRTVLPTPPDSPFLDAIAGAADVAIHELGQEGSPVHDLRRINEASRYFEDLLRTKIDAHPDFSCRVPPTAEGGSQRSGYPDLRIEHVPSRAVAYLDPKLYEETSETSSFRSFYFSPKTGTNKILEDAHHLILGIAHDGNDGDWKFPRWRLVDLSSFEVGLKIEFQASNRDLYGELQPLRESTE